MEAQIIELSKRGDADTIRRIFSTSESNPFSQTGGRLIETALLTACEFGQLSVVRMTVGELKCNPNCIDASGRSPLHMSVLRKQNGKIAVAIVKFLVSRGSKIRKSVLHVCNNDMAVLPLIELGADVNAKSVDGFSPISVAVSGDRQEVVSELIRGGANLSGDLFFKAQSATVVMELIRNKMNPSDAIDPGSGKTALQFAIESGKHASVIAALGRPSSGDVTTPTVAATSVAGDTPSVGTLEEVKSQLLAIEELIDPIVDFNDIIAKECLELSRSITTKLVDLVKKRRSQHSLCTVCDSEQKSVVLMPCRHFCVCGSCAKALARGGSWDEEMEITQNAPCPICRSTIHEFVSVYT